jgi:hypothetical protein
MAIFDPAIFDPAIFDCGVGDSTSQFFYGFGDNRKKKFYGDTKLLFLVKNYLESIIYE